MESSELEDGEVCFSEDDDDQDLSYNIDERIEEVLGHFRKDFEGLVCAESLGPKYGGHGSFLPVDDQYFPISLEPKPPQKVEGCAVLGEKNTDTHDQKHSMGKEKENISASTFKKLQTTTCSRKRKVGGDFAVEAAFSYDIDARIEKGLGHFRKDFEGLVFAESLGSRFGGYGSFFPVDQWDSPISCKGKTPQKKVGSVRCWPIQKGFSVLVNDCASARGSREVFGEKNVDKSMAKEKENVSCSLKKQQTTACCKKRKVVGDVMVEVAFSYNIDERIEKVLGHFRKDFEGLVSAKNLGSKFGKYCSFLPVVWHSSISCKPKSPDKVEGCAVLGEKSIDTDDQKSIGKEEEEEENVSVSTLKKKLQTTCRCRKRKVDDVVVEAAFSYNIDERIAKVLEHLRKDFEGLVSAESLGPKFGRFYLWENRKIAWSSAGVETVRKRRSFA
ncbi:hypothetical protein F0562_020882 [Nyssa sinensis]|uniref:Uncharacterized protein n=1 Tax=Nyssa sinensis TaxID=561372 RepID=A0A5J5BV70_9ASTE|nr:hypothetical protein F0562_020882 [Nyssa sinensis]